MHGRLIEYRVLDDGAEPEAGLELTRQLVDDGVLALLAPGAEDPAVRDYLDAAGVPRLVAAPVTRSSGGAVSLAPSPQVEGRALGSYLALVRPRARVAVLASAGNHGSDLLGGFRSGIAGSAVRLVAVERVSPASADVVTPVAALEPSGADVLAVLAEPGIAAPAAVAVRRLAWRPLTLASGLAGAAADGTVSTGFLKEPTDPAWAEDRGLRLYRAILARHARGADSRDLLHLYGMAAAHALVEVLERAGASPTRASVRERLGAMRVAASPFLLPGIALRTGPRDRLPVEQVRLQRREGGRWRGFGGLVGTAGA